MIVENQIIKNLLLKNKLDLGLDFEKYKNHCNRIYQFCILLDSNEKNYDKYAIAAAYDDLGIWTHKTFDYIEPSIDLIDGYLHLNYKENWKEEITSMIRMHHKRSTYIGKHAETVDVFRMADWIDVTMNLKMYKLSKNDVKEINQTFPYKGFHWFLFTQFLKYFIKHPFNPLPMFRK